MARASNQTVKKILTAALSVFFALLVVALIVNLVKLSAASSRRKALEQQKAYLDSVIDENDRLIDYCRTPEFVENYARDYLDMVYRGEDVIGFNSNENNNKDK